MNQEYQRKIVNRLSLLSQHLFWERNFFWRHLDFIHDQFKRIKKVLPKAKARKDILLLEGQIVVDPWILK